MGMVSPGLVVTVCTANICRSPMAAALLQHALEAQPEPWRSWRVISAGVSANPGERISENSITAMKKVGLDLSRHRAQMLTQGMLDEAVAVLCMTESHRSLILRDADPPSKNIFLFREFLPPGSAREIPDPYGMALPAYEASRDEMVEAIPSLLEYFKTRKPALPR